MFSFVPHKKCLSKSNCFSGNLFYSFCQKFLPHEGQLRQLQWHLKKTCEINELHRNVLYTQIIKREGTGAQKVCIHLFPWFVRLFCLSQCNEIIEITRNLVWTYFVSYKSNMFCWSSLIQLVKKVGLKSLPVWFIQV